MFRYLAPESNVTHTHTI